MSTCPKRGRLYDSSPSNIKRQHSTQGSAVFHLNTSYNGYSPGYRNLDYKENFFQERSLSRSSSFESTPFVRGQRNKSYVSPTFRTSNDFLHSLNNESMSLNKSRDKIWQEAYSPDRKGTKSREHPELSPPKIDLIVNDHSKSPVRANRDGYQMIGNETPTKNSIKNQHNFTKQDNDIKVIARNINEANQMNTPSKAERHEKPQQLQKQSVHNYTGNLKQESMGSPEQKVKNYQDIPSKSEVLRSRSQHDYAKRPQLTTVQRESYPDPETLIRPELHKMHDFIPVNAANKSLVEEKNRRKQIEKEEDREFAQATSTDYGNFKVLAQTYQQKKRDAMKRTLEDNIRILREKEAMYKKRLVDELSNPASVGEKDQLKAYLQMNKSRSNITEDLIENQRKWNQKYKVSLL